MIRTFFNEFNLVSENILDFVFDNMSIDILSDAKSLRQRQRETLAEIFVRNSSLYEM